MSKHIKDELYKLEVTNNMLKECVIQYVDNELIRKLLIQNLSLQGRIINNVQAEVMKNEL